MAAKLSAHVRVTDDDGKRHVFGPGDDVPTWARKKITNPGAWAREPGHPVVEAAKDVVDAVTPSSEPSTGKRESRKPPKSTTSSSSTAAPKE